MVEVAVFCEGPTEEQFIKRVVAPPFRSISIFIKPSTLKTSEGSRGGAVSFDRLKFYARNTLRQNSSGVLSTFIDLYGLDTSFPDFDKAQQFTDPYAKAECLEEALRDAIVREAGCRPDRFIPHIQPYEFEGLLFSDIEALVSIEPGWGRVFTSWPRSSVTMKVRSISMAGTKRSLHTALRCSILAIARRGTVLWPPRA